jgi:hypothetical protein
MSAALERECAPEWKDRHGGHAASSRGRAEESAIDDRPAARARSLSPFLLVKTSPIGSELNDIGGASTAPVEVNKNNLGAET